MKFKLSNGVVVSTPFISIEDDLPNFGPFAIRICDSAGEVLHRERFDTIEQAVEWIHKSKTDVSEATNG